MEMKRHGVTLKKLHIYTGTWYPPTGVYHLWLTLYCQHLFYPYSLLPLYSCRLSGQLLVNSASIGVFHMQLLLLSTYYGSFCQDASTIDFSYKANASKVQSSSVLLCVSILGATKTLMAEPASWENRRQLVNLVILTLSIFMFPFSVYSLLPIS